MGWPASGPLFSVPARPYGACPPLRLTPGQLGANEAAHHAGDKREPSQQQHEPPRLALKRRIRGDDLRR
ncbi:hypothetical protein QUV74_22195, partial [Xanthomonas citri pv. citri]